MFDILALIILGVRDRCSLRLAGSRMRRVPQIQPDHVQLSGTRHAAQAGVQADAHAQSELHPHSVQFSDERTRPEPEPYVYVEYLSSM